MPRKRETDTTTYPEYVWLAANLKRRREELGWSQINLAEAMKQVDQAYVSALERMQINPTLEVLSKFARALGCSAAELVAEPPEDLDVEYDDEDLTE